MRAYAFVAGGAVGVFLLAGRFTLDRAGAFPAVDARWIVGPLTLAILLVWFLLTARRRLEVRAATPVTLFALLFAAWLGSAIFRPLNTYITLKATDAVIVAVLCAAAAPILADRRAYLPFTRGLMWAILGIAALYAALITASAVLTGSRGSTGFGGPNVATRVLFMGIVAGFYLTADRAGQTLFRSLIGITGVMAIVLVGSRGGMVAAAFTGVLALWAVRRRLRIRVGVLRGVVVAAILAIPAWMQFGEAVTRVWQSRVYALLIARLHFASRDRIITSSLDAIREQPVTGYGLGGYSFMPLGQQYRYPHNIGLELMLDLGVLGAAAFLALVFMAFRSFRHVRDPAVGAIAIVPLYLLLTQQFSGGLYDFRYFFMFILLVYAHAYHAARTRADIIVGWRGPPSDEPSRTD